MQKKQVTILIPNHKTPEITKICMRLIRQHTDLNQVEVIVIDNNSGDASVEYLRTLSWITLIERKGAAQESGPLSHSRALDLALEQVKTPFVLSIHTDTFVKHSDWINILLAPFKNNPNIAGVGSWKLESKNELQMLGYRFEQMWKYCLSKLFSYQGYNSERLDVKARYLRSHCAMYNTEIIRGLNTCFSDEQTTAGKAIHRKMIEAGYEMLFLPTAKLGKYVDHLNHATMVLNPEFGSKKKVYRKGNKRIKKGLRGVNAVEILSNDSLDL